ncbi:MAG: metalloregulator ArsR/SmtB family transcription factor [Armatimonadota bacterium]|nr:metalloregulator ArsR/SmtB family transcription factor [Armatimonadota bacterium]MDR7440029.1 metalloregulator ArsR/SmtB family transcription factor [Armatimonadota bacterium]MDR7562500.1 metalloregulator ArsR/SmtB family transcription factor [Armatimonadota bacterium]MDR7566801.1 metalloregulator ArsR/SmtB family transcription factor [Armatimonadota bacterium]MDR7601384.1 metalloregulator ArsR/SmtB family transcription factor [Armatimonadota bacterium]
MGREILLSPPRTEPHLRVEASPVYDFLAALFVVYHHGRSLEFDVSEEWIRRARRALGSRLLRDLARFAGPRAFFLSLVTLLDRHVAEASVPAFVEQVARLPAEELVLLLLTSTPAARPARPYLCEILTARSGPTRTALRRFARAFPQELGRREAVALARRDPREVQEGLVWLLRRFYQAAYAPEEKRILPLLQQDAARKRERARCLTPQRFVEEATGGLVLDPTAVSEVVVAPSHFVQPYNLVVDHGGIRTYITPLTGGAAPDTLEAVRRVAKALADESRLRILRLLAERAMYTQQIAEALGTSHVTVLHHLAVLRAARLIRVVERQQTRWYIFHPQGLESLLTHLRALLRSPSAQAGDLS